jgi:general secretion pathway protein N
VLNFKQGAPFPLERMDWSISFRSIFSGSILLLLRESASPQKPPAEIYLGIRQVELRNIAIELPAAAMGELNPMLQAMHFQGLVAIATDNLVLQRNGSVTGKMAANWQMAGSALSPVNPFGNYRFDLAGTGDNIQIGLSTVSGDLQLNGQGQWLTSGQLSFQTTASAVGASKEVFSEMLHHLGPETAPGVFTFKIGS